MTKRTPQRRGAERAGLDLGSPEIVSVVITVNAAYSIRRIDLWASPYATSVCDISHREIQIQVTSWHLGNECT